MASAQLPEVSGMRDGCQVCPLQSFPNANSPPGRPCPSHAPPHPAPRVAAVCAAPHRTPFLHRVEDVAVRAAQEGAPRGGEARVAQLVREVAEEEAAVPEGPQDDEGSGHLIHKEHVVLGALRTVPWPGPVRDHA